MYVMIVQVCMCQWLYGCGVRITGTGVGAEGGGLLSCVIASSLAGSFATTT